MSSPTPTGPRSAYGETKLDGERHVLAASTLHTVVRTAWLYGVGGPNFVETMLRLAGGRERLGAARRRGRPIGSPDMVGPPRPGAGPAAREVRGVVHAAGSGEVSWNGFARKSSARPKR